MEKNHADLDYPCESINSHGLSFLDRDSCGRNRGSSESAVISLPLSAASTIGLSGNNNKNEKRRYYEKNYINSKVNPQKGLPTQSMAYISNFGGNIWHFYDCDRVSFCDCQCNECPKHSRMVHATVSVAFHGFRWLELTKMQGAPCSRRASARRGIRCIHDQLE